jgi:hypothetical protein
MMDSVSKSLLVAMKRIEEEEKDKHLDDTARMNYIKSNYNWIRRNVDVGLSEDGAILYEEQTFLEVRVPDGSDLSCKPMVEFSIDRAILSNFKK